MDSTERKDMHDVVTEVLVERLLMEKEWRKLPELDVHVVWR
jgi:hypothetical protein